MKRGRGWWLESQRGHHIILTKYEAVQSTVVSENFSSSGILTILIKVQAISILSKMFGGKFTHYSGGSKSSETNPIPKYGFILSDPIRIPLIEAFVPDRINAPSWLVDDVITYQTWSRDAIYGDPDKALTPILKWWFTLLMHDFAVLNRVDIVVYMLNYR